MGTQQDNVEAVYSYIKERFDTQQGSPAQQEIADHCELSVGTVGRVLDILQAQSRITRTPYKSRSIRLARKGAQEQTNEMAESVYSYLEKTLRWGDVPSQQEIADECLLSRTEVRAALLWLEAQGRIERVKVRGWNILP